MLSTQVNKQWSGKKLSRGGQLPEFYVLLIKPLLIASRTPFITKIYLTLIQCPPTYIWRVPNFPSQPPLSKMKYSSSMDGGEEGGGCLLFWWRHGWLGPNTAVSQRVPDRHQHNCCITITLEPVSRINYITSRLLNISYWMSTQKYVSLQLQ